MNNYRIITLPHPKWEIKVQKFWQECSSDPSRVTDCRQFYLWSVFHDNMITDHQWVWVVTYSNRHSMRPRLFPQSNLFRIFISAQSSLPTVEDFTVLDWSRKWWTVERATLTPPKRVDTRILESKDQHISLLYLLLW